MIIGMFKEKTKIDKIRILLDKIFAYIKYTIHSAFGLKWECYLAYEKKNWEKWFTPSLYTWKGRFEAFGYEVDLDNNQALSQKNCIKWESFQRQFGLNTKGEILVVEVGSGPSGIGYAIRGKNTRVVCLDPLLNKYRKIPFYRDNVFDKVINKFMCTCIGETIALKSSVADVVFCINVLDHCKNPEIVLDEIERVLKKGGVLILDVDVWFGRKPWVIDVHPSRETKDILERSIKRRFRIISVKHRYKRFGYGGGFINRVLLLLQFSKFGEIFYVLEKR